jgi:putative Ig domain-containing protein
MRGVAFATVLVIAGLAAGSATSARADVAAPPVTVIGDSVLTAVEWEQTPRTILEQGLDVQLQVGICRKLTGVSCPFDGQTVPTLMDLVDQLGPKLGPTVLVEVGYNDDEATFAQEVEQSIDALLAAGVKRILWANMHVWQQQYIPMNAVLAAAARQHPQVKLIDWATYSNNRYSWFQGDGIHLDYDGAVAMATLFNGAIKEALAPPVTIVSTRLPAAHVGKLYNVRLVARGGSGTYTWKSVSGPLPKGLRLLASGRIYGTPRRPAVRRLVLSAVDSRGQAVTERTVLVVDRAPKHPPAN